MSKPLVPEIRFGGYSEPWEQHLFGDITTSYSGGTPQVGVKDYYGGNIPFIRSGEIHQNTTELFITEKGYNESSAAKVEKGDILLALYGATSGEVAISQIDGAINQAILAVKPNTGYSANVITHWLERNKKDLLNTYLQGGQGNLSGSIVKSFLLTIPQDFKEQNEIGEWFNRLDDMIANAEKEVTRLEKMKIASLQKMFPRPGQTTPEVRFGGFTEPWIEHKLGDITTSYSGGTPKVGIKDYYGGSIPFIRSGEIHRSSTELFITELGYKESSAAKVVKGDILFALYGATSGDVAISQIDGVINQAILAIKPNDGFSAYFITYWLEYNKNRLIDTYLQGGQGNLSGTIVKSFNLAVPTSFTEQESIGRYFFDLDNLIAKKRDRIVKLRNIKKACLEKMFVNNTTEQ